jgi:hypothetical protein
MTRVLRSITVVIALAALIDPAMSVTGASRARLALVATEPPTPEAGAVRDRLTRDLAASFEIVPAITSDAAAAVVIGDRFPGEAVPDALVVATVTTAAAPAGVRILRVDAPRDVPPATAIHLNIELAGDGVIGRTTDATVSIAGLEVGRVSHRWTSAAERWQASVDAVPVGDPPFAVRIAADQAVADVAVDVRRAPFRVEFYEPRPSWATTFVRRALEADPRFQVASLSFDSRGISTQAGDQVPLADPRIDAFDVVIAGGLDRLSAADVRSLERFTRERGGAAVLLPDQRIDAGPARDLLGGMDLVERLLEQPAKLTVTPPAAPLQASELLVLQTMTAGTNVIARVPGDSSGASGSPVIVSMPRGDGRLLLSGAMDAWRFRADDHGAFDRFWQSTIAGLALAVPPPIAIDLAPPLLRPGEQGEVIVRVRSRDVTAVRAWLDGDQPIRLQPEPETGVYRGRFTAKGTAGRSTLEVRADGGQPLSASRTLLVQTDVQRPWPADGPALSMLSSSHRGIDVTPGHLADLERFLRAIVSPAQPRVWHPMRSAWWILPFVLCLSAEWWLRRRRGLR